MNTPEEMADWKKMFEAAIMAQLAGVVSEKEAQQAKNSGIVCYCDSCLLKHIRIHLLALLQRNVGKCSNKFRRPIVFAQIVVQKVDFFFFFWLIM